MHIVETRKQWIHRAIHEAVSEHSELLAKTRAIENLVEGTPYPAPGDVARKLRGLAEYLAAHIEEEEKGLLYRAIPEKFPDLRDEVENRRREHVPIVAALRQLADEADQSHDARMESTLGMRIRMAVAAIRQHEAGESSLLHRALRLA